MYMLVHQGLVGYKLVKFRVVLVLDHDSLDEELHSHAEAASRYRKVICEVPEILTRPKKTASRLLVERFTQAIIFGVTTCVQIVSESPQLTGFELHLVSEVAEVLNIPYGIMSSLCTK